jgi:hypothetical protein
MTTMSDLIGIGKYDSERDCILHFMCLSEWSDDSFGDVQDYGAYYWTIMNSPVDVQETNTEFISLLEENGYGITWSPELAQSLVGRFIVVETATGQVDVQQYQTAALHNLAYKALAHEYYKSLDDEELYEGE